MSDLTEFGHDFDSRLENEALEHLLFVHNGDLSSINRADVLFRAGLILLKMTVFEMQLPAGFDQDGEVART